MIKKGKDNIKLYKIDITLILCVIVMIMMINLLAINSKMIRKKNTIHTIQFIYNKRS